MRQKFLFYSVAGFFLFAVFMESALGRDIAGKDHMLTESSKTGNFTDVTSAKVFKQITIFMCGDVMTGRGIDQILPYPSDPLIHEPYMKSAKGYVRIAEELYGPIQQPVSFSYIWGDILEILDQAAPDVRIINLETSITKSNDFWKGKAIHYRMHPENIPSLTAARVDVCSLANNHVLDWGYSGLLETLESLKKEKIAIAGAGRNLSEAEDPAVIKIDGKGRVIVFSFGLTTSGIPLSWGAAENKIGVNLLKDLTKNTLRHFQKKIGQVKRTGDIVVASIHWGSNWGYDIPREQKILAHRLIDEAGVDIIHGHSSHHVKGIEVYKGKLILYGCGDFINDYEGIGGYEEFRADLSFMYIATADSATGKLIALHLTPTQIRRFRVNRASEDDALRLRDIINREGAQFGTGAILNKDNQLTLQWE